MQRSRIAGAIALFLAGMLSVSAQPSSPLPANPHKVLPFGPGAPALPAGILAWDAVSKTVEATNGQGGIPEKARLQRISFCPPNSLTLLMKIDKS